MNGQRFDSLTKRLVASSSRRALARGVVGGSLAAFGLGRAVQARCAREQPINCGGTCVDLRANVNHCGRCGHVCGAGQVCYAGRCLAACPAGFEPCGGTCGRPCGGEYVLDGSCRCVCPPQTPVLCDGTCAECCDDTDCPAVINGSPLCVDGQCDGTCPPGHLLCSNPPLGRLLVCSDIVVERCTAENGFPGYAVGYCCGPGTFCCPTGSGCCQ